MTPQNLAYKRLQIAAVVVGVTCLGLTYKVFEPILMARTPKEAEERKVALPAYDYGPWHAWAVQVDGRIKPFQTAAIEAMRHVTGRSRFEGQDPAAIVLQWWLLQGSSTSPAFTDWETYPFILCDHHDLRKAIYEDLAEAQDGQLTDEQLHGRYIAPADLRRSPGLRRLLDEAQAIRDADLEKASQLMTPEQRKAREVAGRLVLFDSITQNNPAAEGRRRRHEDPLHLVALDRVPGGAWFSIGELRELREAQQEDGTNQQWRMIMQDRLSRLPQLYISPERQEALRAFQSQIKDGQAQASLHELETQLKQRSDKKIEEFTALRGQGDSDRIMAAFHEIVKTPEEARAVAQLLHGEGKKDETGGAVTAKLRDILAKHDQETIEQLRRRIQSAQSSGYHPDKPEYRMLHLDYLETRFPDVYRESLAWQAYPAAQGQRVLAGYADLREAYKSEDVSTFSQAAERFLQLVREVSEEAGPYPGTDTPGERIAGMFYGRPTAGPDRSLLDLEMSFDRVQPFMWAWIIMLASVLLFIASMAVESRFCYWLAFAAFVASLGYQVFGFYVRVSISGRPPVTNMYETVVWVAFMSAIFALILELIYPRKLIGLAGALVATLGLVLADQLPLTLDPKISPIVPVLRSNYWLTIHVLTIVSSYAGGTLAWGLGNIGLGLLAFGKPRPELVKTLSQFTYRSMQIAVLLLAAGTFLGGWWAAESWGRFWGWDPKEVWALIALVCYVIPLHARFIGWVKDFGLAVAAVLCYAAIVMSWYGVNFVLGAGLHSYGFGGGGPWWVFWAGLLNIEWVIVASMLYLRNKETPTMIEKTLAPEYAQV